ncbi:hypothetical protein [Zooshikella harenae]|uniref:Uncharacterized protein n=1 Tax=Zooshikella harenae TaxID=2827238 RepID=A0ABS5ZHS9_9GAMM|nr:hypothetical protein [Zooshikella harenae]MBU2713597.1 hypothetical protein [Zooshikella harenae]
MKKIILLLTYLLTSSAAAVEMEVSLFEVTASSCDKLRSIDIPRVSSDWDHFKEKAKVTIQTDKLDAFHSYIDTNYHKLTLTGDVSHDKGKPPFAQFFVTWHNNDFSTTFGDGASLEKGKVSIFGQAFSCNSEVRGVMNGKNIFAFLSVKLAD